MRFSLLYNHGKNGKNSGQGRIYELDSANWNQIRSNIDGEADDDGSGYFKSISMDMKNRVVIEP